MLITLLLLCFQIAQAQPGIAFIRTFDEGADEHFYDIYSVEDGGYICCGITGSIGNPAAADVLILRINSNGQEIWHTRLNAEGRPANALSIIETDNGDFVLGGARGDQFNAMRISNQGDVIWRLDYGVGVCQAVIELKDNDFLLSGVINHNGGIIRINSEGQVIWRREYSPGWRGYFYSMRESDGNAILVGNGKRQREAASLVWITKVALEDGREIWSNLLDNFDANIAYSIVSARDGSFTIAGWAGEQDMYLIRISNDGQVDWLNVYESESSDECYSHVRLADGGYVLVGRNYIGGDLMQPKVIRTDSQGSVRWSASYSFEEMELFLRAHNYFSTVTSTHEGAIIACGTVKTRENDNYDALVMKLEPDVIGVMNLLITPEDTVVSVLPEQRVLFGVEAVNVREEDLHFEWTIGDSVFSTQPSVSVAFIHLGEERIACDIQQDRLTIRITWHITVSALFIASSSPDTLALSLRRGTSQTFSLDTVRAVEGDPVEYQWTLTNLDNFEREETGTEASATIEFLRSGNYQMEGLAYRGESNDNVIWTIAVRSAILDFWPRSLRLSVPPDSSGEFGVIPFNSESDSLSYRWEVDGDSVGSDSTVSIRFAWDDRRIGNPPYQVSAIVMDGMEGDTVAWEVTVQDPNATPPSIEGGENPTTFGIISVSPNPFNSTTTIRFTVQSVSTSLRIYGLDGRLMDELNLGKLEAGKHSIEWNAEGLPGGIYLIRINSGTDSHTMKAVLLK